MCFQRLRQRRIQRLINRLGDPSDTVAASAERALIRYGDEVIGLLLPMNSHPDPRVRYRVVWILGRSGSPNVFATILQMTNDPDPRVAYDAIAALGELGDARAVQPLQALAARHEHHPDALGSAARSALARLGFER